MSNRLFRRSTTVVLLATWIAACGGKSNPATPIAPTPLVNPTTPIGGAPPGPEPPPATPPPTTPPPPTPPPLGTGSAVITAIGDVGWCGSAGMTRVSRLLQTLSGTLILAGDLAYMRGRTEDFRNCFDPDFGRFRSRFRPVPGNHEYEDANANGYFTYFGDAAGPGRTGYYSFRPGPWHVLMLNSEVPVSPNSPQYAWVRDELRTNPSRCTMAVWHRPFATSGPNGPTPYMRDIWQLLVEHNAELVISAHDHFYERFGPMDAAYQADRDHGVRQFIAGSGGAPLYRAVSRFPNSEMLVEGFGVLKMTLQPGVYDWEFIDATTGAVTDRGQGQCH